ncbi:hypothetical protein LRY65_00035 [Candidatus Woesebacteria bacterium]|nr:hypothetical protein [Candidatus Woesebacteria bacterium]MCD8507270.1 hypothetical protein [Candidatus Woesebacteria bacterium]MCD8526596.1 hypothetical protein [Candidatus Woesebacteria bacterium]MCD8545989.1 hypothetical protein [Candidatus Woesebacteria bacterium]
MASFQPLDTTEESQAIDQPARRTIYDASGKEIFLKSFIAGIGLGLGRMIATIIFFGIIVGLFVTYLEPWLTGFMNQLERVTPSFLIPTTTQPTSTTNTDTNRFQYNEEQIFDLFNSFRTGSSENTEATATTTTQ